MAHIRDYDSAVNLIADADYITKGQLLGGNGHGDGAGPDGYLSAPEAGPSSGATAGPSTNASTSTSVGVGTFLARHDTHPYSDEDRRKIEHGQSDRFFFAFNCSFSPDRIPCVYSHPITS